MEQNRTVHMSEVHVFYVQSLPGHHSSKWQSYVYQVLIDKLQVSVEL